MRKLDDSFNAVQLIAYGMLMLGLWWVLQPSYFVLLALLNQRDVVMTISFFITPLFIGAYFLIAFIAYEKRRGLLIIRFTLGLATAMTLFRWLHTGTAFFPLNGFEWKFRDPPDRLFLISLMQTEHFFFFLICLIFLLVLGTTRAK
jgi:hypothetical protein